MAQSRARRVPPRNSGEHLGDQAFGRSRLRHGIQAGKQPLELFELSAGRRIDMLALAVAGWMRYVSGRDEAGRAIEVSDPLTEEFARITAESRVHGGGDPAALARGLMGIRAIFGDDLPADQRFAGRVSTWLTSLFAAGAARTVAQAMSSVA